jgi:hypothetical protein
MIAIENALLSDSVLTEQFLCDLTKCKGGCCVDGDAGAPLEKAELKIMDEIYETVRQYMTAQGKKQVEEQGRYVYDKEFGWVTPTVEGKICAYGFKDKAGIVKCAIEQAYLDGKISWKKPISCHLFPLIAKKSKRGETVLVNYEPREDLCKSACALGKKLKLPVYVFLKEPIIRKFGEAFYEALEATAGHLKKSK